MPKVAMDYSNTIIYKIVCNNLTITDCYIGHTTNFIKRKATHKCSCNCISVKQYNYYVYDYIRNNGGWDNWNMIEIEKYPCNDKNEAEARERYWIEELKSTLNKQIPTRTQKEWDDDNKEYKKEYRNANKDKIKEQKKEYYDANKDKIKEQKKEYYDANKDKIKEQQKEYYDANKDKIRKRHKAYYDANKNKIKE